MQQAWENVEKLLMEVRPHLLRAGIPERQVTMPEAKPEDIKVERYTEIFDWLHKLTLSPEWTNLLKVWKLVAPEVWQGYIDSEIKGLQEQLLLEKAQIAIRKLWKLNRPFFFGRKFKVKDGSESTPTDETPEATSETKQDDTRVRSQSGRVRSQKSGTPAHHRRRGRRPVLHQEGDGSPDGSGSGEQSGS